MITWVLYLSIGIVIGGMAGYYFAKLNDFSKKQKLALEAKLQQTEQELVNYKDQVTTHFRETATLVNSMTESYQKVHEHLVKGSIELCNHAVEVSTLTVSPSQLLVKSGAKTPDNPTTDQAESEAPKVVTHPPHAADNNNNRAKRDTPETREYNTNNVVNQKGNSVQATRNAQNVLDDSQANNDSATNAAVDQQKESDPDTAHRRTSTSVEPSDDSSEYLVDNLSSAVAASPDLPKPPQQASTASKSSVTKSEQTEKSENPPDIIDTFAPDSIVAQPVTQTMAVAEELDENVDSGHSSDRRTVH